MGLAFGPMSVRQDQVWHLVGGWATPLKNISQLGWIFPIYGKIQNVPNHQSGHVPLW
jgi:hypothetical protein